MARADLLLERLPPAAAGSAQALRLRAYSAQHKHDFARALQILDSSIERDPRDSAARLARAEIHLIQGRIDRARSDCAVLALSVDAAAGQLCIASLSLRLGEHGSTIDVLDRWLAQASQDDPRRRYAMVMRATAASRGGAHADAGRWFARALRLAPGDVRTLAAFSRYMRGLGRDRELELVLARFPSSEGLQLKRALAAHAAGLPHAASLAQALGRRYDALHAVGVEPELRDEAEFWLVLGDRPERALELALRNFQEQRDHEDVDILIRAARASGRIESLMPLQGWARSQGITLPMDGS